VRHEGEQVQTLATYSQSASTGGHLPVALTDEEIVRRVSAGDDEMFEILMRRYNQRLYRAARAILQNDSEAEDVVQQAYLNAYRHLDQFEGRAQFSTWLTRIAVYEALARRRRVGGKPTGSEGELVETAASTAPDPERQAYGKELSVLLESALAALPDGYRSVFMLREVDGLSTAETAQCLRVSEATVKTRLHRAKGLLQRKLHAVMPAEAFSFDGARCDRLVAGVMSRLADPSADAAPPIDFSRPFAASGEQHVSVEG
jgi:RNA polymerase sigma-70 factor, ECF subfamily